MSVTLLDRFLQIQRPLFSALDRKLADYLARAPQTPPQPLTHLHGLIGPSEPCWQPSAPTVSLSVPSSPTADHLKP